MNALISIHIYVLIYM